MRENGEHLGQVEVKASPSDGVSELCVDLFSCSSGNWEHVLVSSAIAESWCLGRILLCSGPVELVARLEEGCRSPGGPSPPHRPMALLIAPIPASSSGLTFIAKSFATWPSWGDVEEKVLMSLPTINLSAWGVLKPEPLSPPPALTHVNKRFLNANKKAAAPAHQVRGPGSLGRHFTNVFFAFSGFWLVNKIEEKYSFP